MIQILKLMTDSKNIVMLLLKQMKTTKNKKIIQHHRLKRKRENLHWYHQNLLPVSKQVAVPLNALALIVIAGIEGSFQHGIPQKTLHLMILMTTPSHPLLVEENSE